eukprot:CAMPEP_0201109834 /NCGR_PEP_ID=MMETSP0812-20130820/67965_1 /ASSEMBLY_ACC=CAM_ASM_000668 /TAXON_ID=98059 /ORGANISM="Dinobryon sp., Strain UTEXLB2267" /LENGTH=60 /DNA_ID=CAMNT_0047371999 /DNA_START=262 /DNA_END=440 /DNA_ORIENTATION=+
MSRAGTAARCSIPLAAAAALSPPVTVGTPPTARPVPLPAATGTRQRPAAPALPPPPRPSP